MISGTSAYDLTYAKLSELLAGWGEPTFRAEQVWRWLYKSLVDDLQGMGNLPATLRERLATELDLRPLEVLAEQESATGKTRKLLFRLRDGNTIESVLMHYRDRRTACISTQAGCGMGCTFCATGQGGLARNLTSGEIVAQVLWFAREIRAIEYARAQAAAAGSQISGHPVTNVVLMGMGEPLANYDATWSAIETLTDERGYDLGARRITLSTVGLAPGIRRLAGERLPINLAVSLHAPDDELRNLLVPVNRRYPLGDLVAATQEYVNSTGRRATIEYALIAHVNDAPLQARKLSGLLRDLLCHVNLIPLNPTLGSILRPSPPERVRAFRDELAAAGVPVTVRMRRGIDIEAGCGQLRQRLPNEADSAAIHFRDDRAGTR
jgi:23S rRNA (adenine2503-C2)-methyltransferase